MSARLKGSRRLTQAREKGQSLPLIVLMIVVLVAMVGLSVDVGNTFSEERQAVAAGNAASIAAMDAYLDRSASTTTQSIYQTILNTLNSNGVSVVADTETPGTGQVHMQALYLDAQGLPIQSQAGPYITNDSSRAPTNVAFIQVNLTGEVDTYFARVVGRNDLPINATSYAGICPLGAGIYPIAINTKWIEGDRFRNQDIDPTDGTPDNRWRILTSGPYQGRTAMRLDVQDGSSSGGFSWLRWMEDKGATGASAISARELEASLTIPGNAPAGFNEAPWPDNDKPDDYPTLPNQFNVGDWVWGSPGYKQTTDDLMNIHIEEGTRLILPIYDSVFGNGSNARYYINDLGSFVLLGHGQERNEKYIELVYLGDATPQQTACSYSSAPTPGETYRLVGDVAIRPEYAYVPSERKPIQYVVVLDISGSMSANFSGQCDKGTGQKPAGQNYWQCANGPDGAPATQVTGTGPTYYWQNESERRIYVAKKALESLVRSTNMSGNSGYDNTRPDDQMALVWFNENAPSANSRPFSNLPSTIIDNIGDAGAYNNNEYRTSGGTNGAAGLYRASLLLDGAPKTVTANGKTWDYKRVVVFITDGVSNNFLSKSNPNLNGGSSNMSTYPDVPACYVPNVVEIAACQVTGDGTRGGGMWNGMDRPITQAGNVSKEDLQAKGAEVYAISLSNIPATGLQDSIASFPKFYFSADTLESGNNGNTNVDDIMLAINTMVETGQCVPRSDVLDGNPEFKGTILPSEYQARAGLPTYPQVGEVLLENVENGSKITIPIIAGSDGSTSYAKDDVPQGQYKLTPYVFYRHPLDPAGTAPRRYSLIDTGAGDPASSMVVRVGPQESQTGSFVQQTEQDLKLRLYGDVCATSVN